MRKRLRYYYRYFIRSRRVRQLINLQSLIVVIFAASIFTVLAIYTPDQPGPPQITATAQTTPTVDPAAGPTRTPLPPEYLETHSVTLGISIGAAILVLIVVIGVITYMPKAT